MGAMHRGECASFHRAALWNGPVHGCSSSYGLIPYHTAIETLEFVTSMSKSCGIEFWMMMFRSLQPEWRCDERRSLMWACCDSVTHMYLEVCGGDEGLRGCRMQLPHIHACATHLHARGHRSPAPSHPPHRVGAASKRTCSLDGSSPMPHHPRRRGDPHSHGRARGV